MTDPRRARRARERLLALAPPAKSLTPADLIEARLGAPLAWNNPAADATAWAQALRTDGLPDAVRAAHAAIATGFADVPRLITLVEAAEAAAADETLTAAGRDLAHEIASRGRLALAFLGHYPSTCIALHAVDLAAGGTVDDAERRLLLTTRAELSLLGHRILLSTYAPQVDGRRAETRRTAWQDLVAEAELVSFWQGLDRPRGAVRDDTGFDSRDPDHPNWFAEEFGPASAPASEGVVVFPASILEAVGKGENRTAVREALGTTLGARLPLVPVPADWDVWQAEQVERSPWLAAVPRALRAEQGGRRHWGHTVLCVAGPPGCGKTRLVRQLAQSAGLAYARLNAEAASDTAAFGTSVRWASAQAGIVEQALVSARSATALIHYDELEKAAGSRQSSSGKITDLLHGLWEPETASAWRSVWLGQPIDAGHIVHVVTVNGLDGLPSSLVDRMRVVHVGEPGAEHLSLLALALAREACRELGLDERWGDLDREELGALAEAWRGGSVRRLQRLVRGLLQARDLPASPVARH